MQTYITTTAVNARAEPSMSSEVKQTLPQHTTFKASYATHTCDNQITWGHCAALQAWVALEYNDGDPLCIPQLAMPFIGSFPVSQRWGSNAAYYSRFLYDGTPLRGHNGIDFAAPVGTPCVAMDDGTAIKVGFEVGGIWQLHTATPLLGRISSGSSA